VEPFGGAIANFFRGQRHGFRTFRCYLHVASQSLTLYHVLMTSLGSFQYCKICFKLSEYWLWRDKVKFEIFRGHIAYLHSIL